MPTINKVTLSLQNAVLSLVAITLLSLPATAQLFKVQNQVSDISNVGTQPTDSDLVNPWGIAASSGSPWWVSDNATGKMTLYDGTGAKQGLVVNVLQWDGTMGGNPTGMVFNGTQDFKLTNGSPAVFMVSTEDGTIQGWNTGTVSEIKVQGFPAAVYKGLALGSAGGANYIYAANFRAATVDVFDANFQPHSFGSNAFTDPTIPSGYAPFNVANVNGNIVVSYALQDDDKHDDIPGLGHGYIRVYDSQGNLLQQLPHIFQLNSPWAMVVAPDGWGIFSGKLLVGQFGSGAIVAFDLANNRLEGVLQDGAGLPIRINGLWGLGFGNGGRSGPATTLYFASGYFDEAHGLFGTITVDTNFPAHSGK
ncbi:MAG TPA: TIGR03118 family protein [Terriglobales bacterium]|nr:TIGR03118 family protein [Terriglobales bacterium]